MIDRVLTEDEIEDIVARKINALDRAFLRHEIDDYYQRLDVITAWADRQYAARKAAGPYDVNNYGNRGQ